MTNETERDAYAMALMGRSATDLNPLIEDGAEGYKLLTDAMQKYDLDFIDDETLQKANDFNDQIDIMKSVTMIALQNIGSPFNSSPIFRRIGACAFYWLLFGKLLFGLFGLRPNFRLASNLFSRAFYLFYR